MSPRMQNIKYSGKSEIFWNKISFSFKTAVGAWYVIQTTEGEFVLIGLMENCSSQVMINLET